MPTTQTLVARERRQAAANKYQPREILTLLVAEAPPNDDDRYFYFEHMLKHDALFMNVAEIVLGAKPSRSQKAIALEKLKDAGVFLIDLKLDPLEEGEDLQKWVPDLVKRCRELKPKERIVILKCTVFDAAFEAMNSAGLPVVAERIPFPTRHLDEFRRRFRKGLSAYRIER